MNPAYILAGGQSSRFGSDKARYQPPGSTAAPQIVTLVDALRKSGHDVHVVADRADRYADLGLDCLVDREPGLGPLAGLASALAHRATTVPPDASPLDQWLMLVSCDQRNWQDVWYDALAIHTHRSAAAILYYDSQWQPLPGLYHVQLLDTVVQHIQQRRLSFHALLDALGEACVKVEVTEPPSLWSFNTPEDLNR